MDGEIGKRDRKKGFTLVSKQVCTFICTPIFLILQFQLAIKVCAGFLWNTFQLFHVLFCMNISLGFH